MKIKYLGTRWNFRYANIYKSFQYDFPWQVPGDLCPLCPLYFSRPSQLPSLCGSQAGRPATAEVGGGVVWWADSY